MHLCLRLRLHLHLHLRLSLIQVMATAPWPLAASAAATAAASNKAAAAAVAAAAAAAAERAARPHCPRAAAAVAAGHGAWLWMAARGSPGRSSPPEAQQRKTPWCSQASALPCYGCPLQGCAGWVSWPFCLLHQLLQPGQCQRWWVLALWLCSEMAACLHGWVLHQGPPDLPTPLHGLEHPGDACFLLCVLLLLEVRPLHWQVRQK